MTYLADIGSFIVRNALLILLVVLLAGFVIVHLVWYIRPSAIKTRAELRSTITSGKPTVVEYYTNL